MYLDQYVAAQMDFHNATQQPYFKQTEEIACRIFHAYRDAYRSILNDIYLNTTIGDLQGILNKDISDAFKKADSPVGIFKEQIDNGDLRCFSGDVRSLYVRFDCENKRFLISNDNEDWDTFFEYPLTVDEFKKALRPGYIDHTMSQYKDEVKTIIYQNSELEKKRYQRLREIYMQENIERI